jgi:hypothetical protein
MATHREVPRLETNAASGYGCKPIFQNDLAGFALRIWPLGQNNHPASGKSYDQMIILFMSILLILGMVTSNFVEFV